MLVGANNILNSKIHINKKVENQKFGEKVNAYLKFFVHCQAVFGMLLCIYFELLASPKKKVSKIILYKNTSKS